MTRMRDAARTVASAASASWIRWALTLVILGVALWFAVRNWDSVVDGWRTFLRADFGWVLFSAAMVALSLYAMAEVMRLLLRSAHVPVTRRATNSLVLAANAWSVSVPGGVAFSTALQVRRMLSWKATPVVISWFILLSGALSALGLVALAVASLFFIGRAPAWGTLIAAGTAVLAVTALLWWFSRNTTLIESAAAPVLRLINRIRRKPLDTGATKLRHGIRQLTEVRLSPGRMTIVFGWSFLNWVFDVVCLYAAVRAVGVEDVSATVVLLAFVSGKAAGFIQATPGGVGPIEAVLTGTLVASGMVGTDAVATVLIYRLVSFILPAVVGWIIYLVGFHDDRRTMRDGEPGTGPERDAPAETPPGAATEPTTEAITEPSAQETKEQEQQ